MVRNCLFAHIQNPISQWTVVLLLFNFPFLTCFHSVVFFTCLVSKPRFDPRKSNFVWFSQCLRMRGSVWTCVCRCTSLFLMQLVCSSHRYSTEHHGRAFRQHCDWRHVSYLALWDLRSAPSCHHLAERWRTHPSMSTLTHFQRTTTKCQFPGCTSPQCLSVPLIFSPLYCTILLQCRLHILHCADVIRQENDCVIWHRLQLCKCMFYSEQSD